MADQAQALRELVRQASGRKADTKVLTVTSGKGGVGKSNFTLNFALALQSRGLKVVVFDADFGMANIDVLMGASPAYNLSHLLRRERTIWEILCQGYGGLEYIAGGSGVFDLLRLSEPDFAYVVHQLSKLNGYADYVLLDTGAGLSRETAKLIASSDETILVTTPEPTAMTDAYALVKMVYLSERHSRFRLVVNRAQNEREARQTAERIRTVARTFLDLDLPELGYIPDDPSVGQAVKRQTPFYAAYPRGPASRALDSLADRFLQNSSPQGGISESGGVRQFFQQLFRRFHSS
ncbi:MAG: cobyrinic acid a,c-diamide synthase [Candidatus Reconcilbacillus cellulovorans]|uniref:Cobyrinic acid a,c-diamide synthase n=1 Tax=Candidatus Reconcilbacillus cellulovorans TaxID=1906605 RepID=A0A2A6E2P6_9BACL|nr:MAG: cobyrinic acid a,c-diamide synthase [Candidatus Reconcilbacillus cellulovorans]